MKANLIDKELYYERVTRLVRWLVIGGTLLTAPLSGWRGDIIIILATLGIVFNGLRYIKPLMQNRQFASRASTLLADNLLIAFLVIATGGFTSPYFFYFVFTIFSASYWYGYIGIALVVGFQMLFQISLANLQNLSGLAASRLIVIRTLGLTLLGVLIHLLAQVENRERALVADINDELRIKHGELLGLINSLADPVIAADDDGRVMLYNGAALDLLNTNNDISRQPLHQLLQVHTAKGESVDLLAEAGRARGPWRKTLIYYSGGKKFDLNISAAQVRGSGAPGYVYILRDVTQEHLAEEQKDEFVAVASHELRTPIAIAEANLSTALMPGFAKIESKAKALLEQAHDNVMFLGELVSDLATLAKAERAVAPVTVTSLDPSDVLDQLARDYDPAAAAKSLAFETKLDPKAKAVLTNENLVHEILQNLIVNAIKYTERGKISVNAISTHKGRGVIFSVTDTGIGIAASEKKALFGRFYRANDPRVRKVRGTGLGLYITRKLSDRLGGKIWFESRLNRGSTFFVEIPTYHHLPIALGDERGSNV